MLTTEILEKLKIDDCDLPLFNSHKWYVGGTKMAYLCTNIRLPNGRWTKVYLHRLIMNAPKGVQVDHINGDTWDNRRCNLRLCTNTQNSRNRRKRESTSSLYKGVYWNKATGKWMAYIKVDGAQKHLGLFQDEASAARTYDIAAIESFSAFANLNFPKKI
jgi:hypothetical protein